MIRRWFVAIAGAICLAAAGEAAACSCMAEKTTVIEVLRAGYVVAQGVATGVQDRPAQGDDLGFYDDQIAYTVAVAKSLNRRLPEEVTVLTAADGAMCGVSLEIGAEAMLLLHPDEEEVFSVSLCGQLLVDALIEDWRVLFDAMPAAGSR
ncbi:MAG: hypothetical protein KTR21_17155 [Rhodobacteraceae bacterium]|nr:hypothetical protein [Paracoccaceae bacterium]